MKRIIIFLLALALGLSLAACGAASVPKTKPPCPHQWSEADCLNGSVCALCGETASGPLGHDWTDATCESPSTCTRCSKAQGGILSHSFGDWTAQEPDMTRTCTNCGAIESSKIDREVLMYQLISGHWDFMLLSQNGQDTSAVHLEPDIVGPYLKISGSGDVLYFNGTETISGSLEFQSYSTAEGSESYCALLSLSNEVQTAVVLHRSETDLLTLVAGENSYLCFSKNDLLTTALARSWAFSEDGMIYILRLNDDRTFSANLGGEITGTWHLRAVVAGNGFRFCELSLRYLKDGAPVVATGMVNLGSEGTDLEQYLAGNPQLSFSFSTGNLSFLLKSVSDGELSRLTAALEEAESTLIGSWYSRSVRTYNEDIKDYERAPVTDYSMTFSPDKTFTAQLDQEYTGTWSFQKTTLVVDYLSYSYVLNFDGVKNPVTAHTDEYGNLYFSRSHPEPYKSVYFKSEAGLAQWQQQKKDAVAAILRPWYSTATSVPRDGVFTEKITMGYTITFREDGTFSADMDQTYTGTWSFDEFRCGTVPGNSYTSYHYILNFDGISTPARAYFSSNRLSISSYEVSGSRSIDFTTANLDIRKIEGAWKSASGDPETSGYTLTVNPDGTFTASLGEKFSGTWSFFDYSDEEGCRYGFDFHGEKNGRLFTLVSETELRIWVKAGKQTVTVTMKKS